MDVEINTTRAGGGCGCGGCLSLVFSLGFTVVLTAGILMAVSGSHAGSDAAAIEVYEACPAVTDELGSPLERVPWTMSCGEYEGGGSHGSADWTIKIRGPKGTASGHYAASYSGDEPWEVRVAMVDLPSGKSIDAAHCDGFAPTPRPDPEPEPDRDRDRDERDRDRADRDRPDRGERGDRRGKGGKGGKSKGGKGKRR